ncbi:MAG: DUF4190 domain-containing protein [Agromyces sp.]
MTTQFDPTLVAPSAAEPVPTAAPAAPAKLNLLAIAAIVSVFITPLAGVVLGHIALVELKRSGERGRGLALGALITGYALFALSIVVAVIWSFVLSTLNFDDGGTLTPKPGRIS